MASGDKTDQRARWKNALLVQWPYVTWRSFFSHTQWHITYSTSQSLDALSNLLTGSVPLFEILQKFVPTVVKKQSLNIVKMKFQKFPLGFLPWARLLRLMTHLHFLKSPVLVYRLNTVFTTTEQYTRGFILTNDDVQAENWFIFKKKFSHASSIALDMPILVSLLAYYFVPHWNSSTTFEWIPMKFGKGCWRGDCPFHIVLPKGWHSCFFMKYFNNH